MTQKQGGFGRRGDSGRFSSRRLSLWFMGCPKESQTRSQRPLLLVPRSEKVGRVGEDPGNEVVGKQNWLHLFNKYSYYYNVINILNATFFSADYNCICREIAACLSAYWMSKRCFCILHHLLSKLFSLFTSIDRDKDANGEKINENLCTNRSEKNFDSSLGKKYANRKQINNCWAQHSMVQKEKKGLFNRKLRRGEANFLGKEVISCFALMYRDRLGLVSTDLKWLAFIYTVSETPYDRKTI